MAVRMRNIIALSFAGIAFSFKSRFLERFSRTSLQAVDINDSSDWATWPGDRLPMASLGVYYQKMDAAWGRGKFRTEVWEDDVNPQNDWWTNYAPSKEEIEAAEQGFDFQDPKAWFSSRNIDYEAAKEKTRKVIAERLEAYTKAVAAEPPFRVEDYNAVQEQFFQLQKKFFEYTFRYQDNIRQQQKGQPTLDQEDDGTRFKNDKVDA